MEDKGCVLWGRVGMGMKVKTVIRRKRRLGWWRGKK